MNNVYTVFENSVTKQKIDDDMALITDVILSEVKGVSAIILTGGFGRGEGSVLFRNNLCQPLNDYDLVIISDNRPLGQNLASIRVTLAQICGIRQVDISLMKQKDFANMKFTMANYDLIYASEVIYGSFDRVNDIPKWEAKNLPLVEGIVPLFLFLSSIIQAYPRKKDLTSNELFWAYQQLTKSILGWATAMLIFKGLYDPSYYKRNELFQKYFANDVLLCELVNSATEFKLRPTLDPCTLSELKVFWNAAREAHLGVMKFILPSFYKFKFSTWDYVVARHKLSFVNLAKMLLSKVFRRHHYYDCLNTDLAKLYLCLAIGNPDSGSLAKSKQHFSMITSVKNSQFPSSNLNQYIEQLILSDKNAQMFFERGSDIFYE